MVKGSYCFDPKLAKQGKLWHETELTLGCPGYKNGAACKTEVDVDLLSPCTAIKI